MMCKNLHTALYTSTLKYKYDPNSMFYPYGLEFDINYKFFWVDMKYF